MQNRPKIFGNALFILAGESPTIGGLQLNCVGGTPNMVRKQRLK